MERAPGNWNAVERGLWRAFREGRPYDLRSPDPDLNDPTKAVVWGPERTVRAEVLARLLLAGPTALPGSVRALKLTGALITGRLDLAGGRIEDFIELRGCLFDTQILLSEAHAGTIRFDGCWFPRVDASRLCTSGDLVFARCVVAAGLRLTDAQIGTDLIANHLVVGSDQYGSSFSADGLTVSQDFEADRLVSYGELSLRTARIGGRLSLRGAELRALRGQRDCLNAPRLTVGNTFYLSGWLPGSQLGQMYGTGYGEAAPTGGASIPFHAWGGVRLNDGRFESACLIAGAEFHLGPGRELSMRRIQTPELRFSCPYPPSGHVSLSRARIGNLVDTPEAWPPGDIGLTGFTYESLRPAAAFTVRQRIAWLDGARGEFQPEAYEQLAAALRRDGSDEDAREVLYAKQRRRRRSLPLPGRIWGRVQDVTVGYGYRPGRAALWLVAAWALGTLFFLLHRPAPLKADEVPHWNAALFALSKVLPIVDLGQDGWNPGGVGQLVSAALVLTGWVLATTAAAGATRLLQRG
ncbi:hypothetical protein P3T36_005143 [Kitasatospora sp. MAP12-15]|uniref:oxidoreductase n=1 Tax=unclassified Kitasatospora TaxID=2633591 RepID=UPI002473366F|nr:oxidoreductase [Kitasatospora sp. MAP12-44]MDH6109973.1 hypothetical protein [Kitasatospora sp. MAP12-44]